MAAPSACTCAVVSTLALALLSQLAREAGCQTPSPVSPKAPPTAAPTSAPPTAAPTIEPEESPYDYEEFEPPSPPPSSRPPPPSGPGAISPTPGGGVIPSLPPPPPPPSPPPPPPPPAQEPPSELIRGDGLYLQASPANTYSVNWAAVLDTSEQTRETSITKLSSCGCDLTMLSCDGNCCCDDDCTNETRALFTACFPEGPQPPSLEYCIPETQVARVNLPSSSSYGIVYKEAANPESFAEQLMCIVEDNNPILGVYFMDPEPGEAADLDNPPPSWPSEPPDVDVEQSVESYLIGNPIRAFHQFSGRDPVAVPGGVFTLPMARFSALCDGSAVVPFGLNQPRTAGPKGSLTCQRAFPSLGEACLDSAASPLSPMLFVSYLRLAEARIGNQNLRVELSRITYRNLDGTETLLPAGTGMPTPSFSNNVCNNSLVAVDYVISYAQTGILTRVAANVTLAAVEGDIDGAGHVMQSFSASFAESGTWAALRPSSGSPGYLAGFPLLAGIVGEEPNLDQTSEPKTAVHRLVDGLPLPVAAPRDGTCGVENNQPIAFGSNVVSACSVPLTQEQLRAFCRGTGDSGAPASLPSLPLQLMGGLLVDPAQPTVVGIWGNSDALNINDWIEIVMDSNTTEMVWDQGTATCTNVITGMKMEFLTSVVGASHNPQSQITYARISFVRATWTFQGRLLTPDKPEMFQVENFVQFVPKDQLPAEAVRGNTPFILPRLPADVFYPFTSSARTARKPLAWLLCLLCLSVALLGAS